MSEHSNGESESTPEMTVRMSKAYYEAEIETLAERLLHRLADDDTGALMEFDEIDIRHILSETEEFHREYPCSAIEHGESEPSPGAWSWIDDAVPKESLKRQALDIVAGDVSKYIKQFTTSEDCTYRQDGTTYVRESFDCSETEPATTESNKTADDPSDTAAVDERAPEWELPTDKAGEPDYEAAVERIGLEYDQLFCIDTEYYRYRGRRHDDLVVAPQTEYGDVVEDCLAIPFVWAAYCEGRVGHGTPTTGMGVVRGVSNDHGNSHIGLKPGDSDDAFARIIPEGVPERGAVFVDYWHGEDLPVLALYDDTRREEPAFKFLLPTEEHPTVQMVRDRTSYLLESLPDDLQERLEKEL